MLAQLFPIVFPVFAAAAVGYAWARLGRSFDGVFVTDLVTLVATPCLVFSTLTKLDMSLADLAGMAGVTLLCFALFVVIGVAALRLLRLDLRAFLPSLIFPNTGNMGLPLCLFAFGERGLALAIIFFTVFSMLQFSIGAAISMGSFAPGRLLRMPVLYAVPVSLVFMLGQIPVPEWLSNTTNLVGSLTIPLMLLALGVSLAQLKVSSLGRAFGLSVLRLGMGFAVGWGVSWALDLDAAARGVAIVESAMPVAVFNYLFSQRYNVAPHEIAGLVLLSTAISFATLPLLLWAVV